MAKHARGKSRVVLAPEPQLMAGQLAPNRVLSVRLKPGEDVEWLWTLLPFGGRICEWVPNRAGERAAGRAARDGAVNI
jgi:hypothetical protein